MKIITLLTCIFVFSINAIALNIGTTNIVFTYEDTSLTLEQQAIVSNCVDKLLTPILPFATLDDYGDNNIALYLSNRSRTYNSPIFGLAACENNVLSLPIAKEFTTELFAKQSLQITYTNAFNTIEAFCIKLKTQNISQLTDAEVDEQILLSESQMEDSSIEIKKAFLTTFVGATFHDIPLACYTVIQNGPNNTEHLWVQVPLSISGSFMYLPMIYHNNKWRISFWGMF